MSRRILLADDSVTIQKVIELTFMDEDYEVTAVSNGDEALALLDQLRPDVVIADVHMPGANGYQVCRRAKASRPGLPVLLLVGTFEPFDESQSRAVGADGFLKKPFDSQELLQLVEQLLGGAGAAAPAAPSPAPIAPAMPATTAAVDFGLPEAEPIWGNFEPEAPDAPLPPAASPWSASAPAWEASPLAGQADEQVFDLDSGGEELLVLDEEPLLIEDEPFQLAAAAPVAPVAPIDTGDDTAVDLAPLAVDEEPFRFAAQPPVQAPASAPRFDPLEETEQPFRFDPIPESARPFVAPAAEAESPFQFDEEPAPDLPFAAPLPAAAPDIAEPFALSDDESPFLIDSEPEPYSEPGRAAGFESPFAVSDPAAALWAPEPEPTPEERLGVPFGTSPLASNLAEVADQVHEHEQAPAFAAAADPLPANGAGSRLSDEDVDRIARRVIELTGERAVREIAWEVVPDMAEVVIKDRLRELEAQIE